MVFTNMLKFSGSMFTPTREKAVSQNSLWEHREPDSVSTTHNSAFQFFVCRRVHFYLLAINAWQECGDGVVTIDYWIWYSDLAKHPRKLTDFSRICLCRQLEYHSTLDVESTFNSISQFRIITTIVQQAFLAYFHFLGLVGKDLRLRHMVLLQIRNPWATGRSQKPQMLACARSPASMLAD